VGIFPNTRTSAKQKVPNEVTKGSIQDVGFLAHKEQVKLYLPSELDGLHWSAMPATEGDVVVVDVPVTTLYLPQ